MAISFTIQRTRVTVGKDGYFDVRGISAEDLTFLTTFYLNDLKALAMQHAGGRIPADKMAEVIIDLAKSFPTMVTEIIIRCAGAEEEDREKFADLPFAVTIRAVKAIADLSLVDGGVELGNLLAAIAAQLDAVGLKSGPLMNSLSGIISGAVKTSPT